MSDKIQIKRGLKPIPPLEEGELGYAIKTNEIYIGTDSGTNLLAMAVWVGTINEYNALEEKNPNILYFIEEF